MKTSDSLMYLKKANEDIILLKKLVNDLDVPDSTLSCQKLPKFLVELVSLVRV
jgi:hypothetical protein